MSFFLDWRTWASSFSGVAACQLYAAHPLIVILVFLPIASCLAQSYGRKIQKAKSVLAQGGQ